MKFTAMKIDVKTQERYVLLKNGVPHRWLGPGRHRYGGVVEKLSFNTPSYEVMRLSTATVTADVAPDVAALAPDDELQEVVVDVHQRAWVRTGSRPVAWLGAGRHYVWTTDATTSIAFVDVDTVGCAPLSADEKRVVDPADYQEVTVPSGAQAMKFVDGELVDVLAPGKHAAWAVDAEVRFVVVDTRERVQNVAAQEIMTKDKVTLRLNLSLVYAVVDVEKLARVATEAKDGLYLAAQLAAREAVASRTLEELLDAREALSTELCAQVQPRAAELGMKLKALGVKDVILPGEMKELLNRVIEAKKRAEANVILRREESSSLRALTQTAKLMEEHPTLARLKELEAYKELAGEIGNLHLVVGEGGLPSLQLKA